MYSIGKSLSEKCIALLCTYYHFDIEWAKKEGIKNFNAVFAKCLYKWVLDKPLKN
jgi:hypothetical protein